MTSKKILAVIWVLAVIIRMSVLAWVKDANYVAGMAQGELAYALVTGQGIRFQSLPGCGINHVQNAQNRLIDVQDYLAHYPQWCKEIGMTERPAEEISQNPYPSQMPGMGILLAGTFLLFGQYRYIYLQVIILLLDSLGILMLFWMGKKIFNQNVGLLAALGYALFLPGVRISAAGGIRDAFMPIFYTTCLFLFLYALHAPDHKARWYSLLGVWLGLGIYLRPDVLLLPVFFCGLILITAKISFKEMIKTFVWIIVPVILVLCPWWIRNAMLFNRFMLTSPQLGGTMWESFGEFDLPGQNFWRFGNPFGAVYSDAETFAQYSREGRPGGVYSQEYMNYLDRKAKEAILERPDWYLQLLFRRMVEVPVIGFDWGIDLSAIQSRFLRTLIARGSSIILFFTAALGVLAARRNWKTVLLILSVALYNWAIHLPISVNSRYLFPAYAGLILLAAVGILSGLSYIRVVGHKETAG